MLNYKDFSVVLNGHYIDLYDLRVGEYFIEDTYPEVYRVNKIYDDFDKYQQQLRIVETFNITRGEMCDWFYVPAYYGPDLIRLKPKEKRDE